MVGKDKSWGEMSCSLFRGNCGQVIGPDQLIRFFVWLTGFGLAVSGGITTIAYLNVLPIGYSYQEYFTFIAGRFECYLLPIGILIFSVSIYFPYQRSE